MCGIIGSVNLKTTPKEFKESLNKLSHRGPDEKFIKNIPDKKIKFGMVRLAIQDLNKKLYPFSYKDRYSLIYNGEIYNTKEIWKFLTKAGIKAKTSCDAEVILPLFDQLGADAFKMIQGMFAIAIFDKKLNKLYLARDKFGEKPLYYYFGEQGIYFTSELKSFPKKIKVFSPSKIPDYLSFGFLPDNKTFFENIFKLRAGEFIEYDCKLNYLKNNFYYKLGDDLKNAPKKINKNDLKKDIESVIKNKLVSDVPVGTFLSGGLDSSLITAIVKKHHKKTLHTFSIKFPNSKYDESEFSNKVSKKIGTKHHLIPVDSELVKKNWDAFIKNMDQPAGDPALLPTYFLAKTAKKYVTVVLSGEGMDEFFCGYNRYKKEYQIAEYQEKIPRIARSAISKYSINFKKDYKIFNAFSDHIEHYSSTYLNTFWLSNKQKRLKYIEKNKKNWFDLFTYLQDFDDSSSKQRKIELMQLYDVHYYLSEQLCMKLDEMSMAHSLEGRAPYLDSSLLKYLPTASKLALKTKTSKAAIRRIAKEFLPKEIFRRPKHGFTVPLEDWLKRDMKFLVDDLIKKPHPYVKQNVDRNLSKLLLELTIDGDVGSSMSLWSIIVLDQWLKNNLD